VCGGFSKIYFAGSIKNVPFEKYSQIL